MDEASTKDDPMDTEQPGDAALYSTPLGSPSYSPPELEERTEGEEKVRSHHDGDAKDEEQEKEQEQETAEAKAARRKAKGKGKASHPEHEDDDDDQGPDQGNSPHRKAKAPHQDTPIYPGIDIHWARSALSSHPPASSPTYNQSPRPRFGDADAAMNNFLPFPCPFSSSINNNDDEPNPPPPSTSSFINYSNDELYPNNDDELNPPAPRNSPTHPAFSSELMSKLEALQQHQQQRQQEHLSALGRGRGRGRGRGMPQGWGLEWQETKTPEKIEEEGWGAQYGGVDAVPSLTGWAEAGWEVYDEAAWERAAVQAAEREKEERERERGKVLKLQVPRGSGSAQGARTKPGVGGSVDVKTGGEVKGPSGRKRELVRAVRGYRAILSGTFLNYAQDDVLEVIHRDSDGKLFTLQPLDAGASSGRAHAKNFVPVGAIAGNASGEGKGG
ncbi:hypothetical protein IMSHALPRED_003475 [Imshaugia aleurites]|uniref:Uncharacterized protein n=1 Tax=Imshaugia aleurites TaxID=172621 RepID=A0A8H3F2T0_9LECA|nr:hypothetical protein IMSHALPRED_003475 [Imshaugia aleurites]